MASTLQNFKSVDENRTKREYSPRLVAIPANRSNTSDVFQCKHLKSVPFLTYLALLTFFRIWTFINLFSKESGWSSILWLMVSPKSLSFLCKICILNGKQVKILAHYVHNWMPWKMRLSRQTSCGFPWGLLQTSSHSCDVTFCPHVPWPKILQFVNR